MNGVDFELIIRTLVYNIYIQPVLFLEKLYCNILEKTNCIYLNGML